ncbi:hypothetical protein ACJ41O_008999 [Fusarium nematophilum]
MVASAMVFILEVEDPRYDVSTYGWFMRDLPRHIGHSPVLDASIKSFISSFDALHNKGSQLRALDDYVGSLNALRKSLQNGAPSRGMENMCAIYLIKCCQEMVGGQDVHVANHGEMLMHLLHDTADESRPEPFYIEFTQVICAVVSYTNPNIHLGPWFWQLLNLYGTTRPLKFGDGKSFLSLELATLAEISCFLRAPQKHLYQIRCAYNIMQLEYPILYEAAEDARIAASKPSATYFKKRISFRFQTAYGILLAVGCALNRVLRVFDDDPDLIKDWKGYCDEIILLAEAAASNRPVAASSMASPLALAWATMADAYRASEIEVLLMEYQKDFRGASYFGEARQAQRGFENMEREKQRKAALITSGTELGDYDAMNETSGGCTIL